MITIESTETYGWDAAMRGMRNPKNSWHKSDSMFNVSLEWDACVELKNVAVSMGNNDHDLATRLSNAGPEHRKYRRMINVTCDITAPLYWWKEFDTYKVGTVSNSCSTMHKIASRHLTMDDFSHEHLLSLSKMDLCGTVERINGFIDEYNRTEAKEWWWQIIQLLPSSYNQRRTVQTNYEVLANIYRQRKGHKLDEWGEFTKWIESLPYSELMTLKGGEK